MPDDRLRPKKRLGQHFLREPATAARIAALLRPRPEESIVEVGPGEGILTRHLAALGAPCLMAVEYDAAAVALLQRQSWPGGTRIVHADFLDWPLPAGNAPWVWAGNLPYQITSPILFRLLAEREQVRRAVFMMQREVAQRIASPPGTRESGILSVLLGAWYRIETGFDLGPEAFRPPPKVWSRVIALERRSDAPPVDFAALTAVVKAGYGQRRKQLANALRPLALELPPGWAALRAENLILDQWLALAEQLAARGHKAYSDSVCFDDE